MLEECCTPTGTKKEKQPNFLLNKKCKLQPSLGMVCNLCLVCNIQFLRRLLFALAHVGPLIFAATPWPGPAAPASQSRTRGEVPVSVSCGLQEGMAGTPFGQGRAPTSAWGRPCHSTPPSSRGSAAMLRVAPGPHGDPVPPPEGSGGSHSFITRAERRPRAAPTDTHAALPPT